MSEMSLVDPQLPLWCASLRGGLGCLGRLGLLLGRTKSSRVEKRVPSRMIWAPRRVVALTRMGANRLTVAGCPRGAAQHDHQRHVVCCPTEAERGRGAGSIDTSG